MNKRKEAWRNARGVWANLDREYFFGVGGFLHDNWASTIPSGTPESMFLKYDSSKPSMGKDASEANCPHGRLFASACAMKGCQASCNHTNPASMVDETTRVKIFKRTTDQLKAFGVQMPN